MSKQKGITLVGMLLTMAVVFMVVVVLMRVVPVVIQHYSIVSSIKGLEQIPAASLTGDPELDVSTLKSSLAKRLDISGIPNLKPEELTITPESANKYKVKLKYTVIRPLLYNVGLIFNFDQTIEVAPKVE